MGLIGEWAWELLCGMALQTSGAYWRVDGERSELVGHSCLHILDGWGAPAVFMRISMNISFALWLDEHKFDTATGIYRVLMGAAMRCDPHCHYSSQMLHSTSSADTKTTRCNAA